MKKPPPPVKKILATRLQKPYGTNYGGTLFLRGDFVARQLDARDIRRILDFFYFRKRLFCSKNAQICPCRTLKDVVFLAGDNSYLKGFSQFLRVDTLGVLYFYLLFQIILLRSESFSDCSDD